MKRIFSTFCLLLIALATIQAQYKMEVKTTDGHSFSFLTDEIESIIWNTCDSTTHDFVDLGLSVKWATCNVGATKPEEYGDYFAWGETEPHYEPGYAQLDYDDCHWKPGKVGYSWDTYNYCKGSSTSITKYCDFSYYAYNGITDNKTVLDPEDDAAFMNWGGNWRMPTISEIEELCDTCNCTWTWTTYGGIHGFAVVSKIPNYVGNWIFLPAAGERYLMYRAGTSINCYYWSSSLSESNESNGQNLLAGRGHSTTYNYRFAGLPVRPVCSKEASTDTPTDTPTDAVLVTVYDLIDTEWEYYSYDFKTSTEPQPDVITSIIYAFKNSTEVRQVIKEVISGPGIGDTVIIKSDKILKYNLNDPYLTIGDQPLSFKFDSKHKFHSLDDDKVYEMIDY